MWGVFCRLRRRETGKFRSPERVTFCTVAPAASCFPLVATSGALPRNSLASSATGGTSLISTAEKVTKKPLETKVSRLPFCGAFYKTNCRRASFGTLFSITVLTLQCAALRAARHFFARDACHEHFCEGFFAPPGAPHFAHGGKVGKTPLETKVSRLPFCGRFHEANCRCAPFGTLFSIAVLTLQCAACPAARHFVVRDACHGHYAQECSALRRGLLFARTKSNQKFAKTYGFGIPICRGFL